MVSSSEDRTLERRRRLARIALLKRRTVVASVLAFAAFFGLAAQHAVKGTSTGSTSTSANRSSLSATPSTFFDDNEDGFAFGTDSGGTQSVSPSTQSTPSSPPVAQSSVS